MKKILALVLALLFLLPAQTAIFDDVFGANTSSDNGRAFIFRIVDSLKNGNQVSFQERKLKLRVFFDNDFFDDVEDEKGIDLQSKFNAALKVQTQLTKDGTKDKLGQGLTFKLQRISEDSSDDDYSIAVFESSRIVITESQQLTFTFDQESFADSLGIDIDSDDKKKYVKTFNFKPITLELSNILSISELDANNAQNLPLGSLIISGNFNSDFALDINESEFSFDLFRNKKPVKALAKRKRKKFFLNPSLVSNGATLTGTSSEGFDAFVPVGLTLKNQSQASKINPDRLYTVKIPLLIKTKTQSGLELKIKTIVKSKLNEFLIVE